MYIKIMRLFTVLTFLTVTTFGQTKNPATGPPIAANNVVWHTMGSNENDSMPIGNGDIAANVWTEKNGDIVVLLAKADAWAETGNIIKLGRVRIKLNPNPFADSMGFIQTLRLDNGSIEIGRAANKVTVWADANNPVLHVQANLSKPAKISATLEMWRKTTADGQAPRDTDIVAAMNGAHPPKLKPDIIFPAGDGRLAWCHYNAASYYPYLMRQEHLESLLSKFPDPLYQRCFGVLMTGEGQLNNNGNNLISAQAKTMQRIDMIALAETKSTSPQQWYNHVNTLANKLALTDINAAYHLHNAWWKNFWERSWIRVSGSPDAQKVSQGYAMQRYMVASSSRGEIPVKFNGGLFTVGHDIAEGIKQTNADHDADYRAWGDNYWNQNNRLIYWPLIATGDTDLLKPWFNMYLNALPFAKARNQQYYHHDGASYPETMHFWAMPRIGDFGKNNPTNEIQSHWQRYHIQGTLELIAQMLDMYDHSGNKAFAQTALIPFADAIITYYDQHWQRGSDGKIYMYPTQSLETYQLDATNPTPDIAGLMSVIPRMLALPAAFITPQQRVSWTRLLRELPPIPIGKTAKGKIPPLGVGDTDGIATILPAAKYGKPGNSENPELYVTFPYRLYGVGKPGLELARNTFTARRSPQNTCWGQDGTQAAVLGLTQVAQKAAIAEFGNYGDQRFQWFWKAAHDWIPDLDNGGSGMITLQNMLMQCDGANIRLAAAWPGDWTADFKLHAPYQTTVEGHIENGKISNLKVLPASRARDVIIVN